MGVTRIRFLLRLWQRSSLNLSSDSSAGAKERETNRWVLPRTNASQKGHDPLRPPPRPPG